MAKKDRPRRANIYLVNGEYIVAMNAIAAVECYHTASTSTFVTKLEHVGPARISEKLCIASE